MKIGSHAGTGEKRADTPKAVQAADKDHAVLALIEHAKSGSTGPHKRLRGSRLFGAPVVGGYQRDIVLTAPRDLGTSLQYSSAAPSFVHMNERCVGNGVAELFFAP